MRPCITHHRKNARQRGASAVDMAVTLPFILIAIFMVFEAGNVFNAYLTVQKASQLGARYAVSGQGELEGNRLTQIKNTAMDFMTTLPGPIKTVSVSSWAGLSASGTGRADNPGAPCDTVEVKTTYAYVPLTPILGPIFKDLVVSGHERKVNEPWNPCK